MKFSALQISFAISLFIHGAIFSAVCAFRHFNAPAHSAFAIENSGEFEMVVTQDETPVSRTETATTKISEIIPAPAPIQPVMATPNPEIIPATSPMIKAPSVATDEAQNVLPVPPSVANENSASHPDYLINPKPAYPVYSLRYKQEGLVVLGVLVSDRGEPTMVQIIQSSGYDSLDQSALQTVMKWQFVPARMNNATIESSIKIPIHFKLSRQKSD